MLLAQLLAGFQSLPPLSMSKLGLSGADSWVGGFVYVLGPCGSLQRSLLRVWEFSPLPPEPPLVFSIRGLRLYFPLLEPWVAWSVSLPSCSSQFICMQTWDHGVYQPLPHQVTEPQPCPHWFCSHCLAVSLLHPGCPPLPSYWSG